MPAFRPCAAAFLCALTAACSPEARLPNLQEIYTSTAEAAAEDPLRRPLIAIPGTLGSRLVDSRTGEVIWGGGGSAGISADPSDPEEYALIALPIPKDDEPLSELVDTVRPDGILETAEADVLGIPIDINVYGESLQLLAEGGFTVERRTGRSALGQASFADPAPPAAIATPSLDARTVSAEADDPPQGPIPEDEFDTFQFDYDWRRDLIESAHAFGAFLERRRKLVAGLRGVPPEDVRFDLLAHSMGTLVARYFLMYGTAEPGEDPEAALPEITWAGADFFERVVFVAPPNGGSIIAMDNLINGKELGPLQPVYPSAMLATHPSPYQLMPRNRHKRVAIDGEPLGDIYDLDLWERMGWGLADPLADAQLQLLMPDVPDAETRRARALRYKGRLLNRARVFHRMMDSWAPPPAHLDLFLVVGGGFETPATAEIDSATGIFRITGNEEGDGVVLRASALLDERLDGDLTRGFRSPLRFKTTLFLPDEHVELTRNRVFGDNLLFWLLEAPRGGAALREARNAGFLGNVAESGARALQDPVAPAPAVQSGSDR